MKMSKARYWIARYTRDVFRNEPINIGIVLDVDGVRVARFLGETAPGQIDGRRIPQVKHSGAYKQWIDYWRKEMVERRRDCALLGKTQYQLVERGEVTDTGTDSPDKILSYLFDELVSDNFVENSGDSTASRDEDLSRLITDAFRQFNILASSKSENDHLIHRDTNIQGKVTQHTVDFAQKNGSLCVMQVIDFTKTHKRRILDRAGHISYIHRDISEFDTGSEQVTLVNMPEDIEDKDLRNAHQMIANESKVFNWPDEDQRKEFLELRRSIARLS